MMINGAMHYGKPCVFPAFYNVFLHLWSSGPFSEIRMAIKLVIT